MIGMLLFVGWIALQGQWAMVPQMHQILVVAYAKYLLLIVLIYTCIDTTERLKLVLWTHVLGCVYLGYLVLTEHVGGRFEGFSGPDINEANAGALQIVTGIITAGALFLDARWKERGAIVLSAPLIVNALVATVSRSGFLAVALAGFVFNLLSPSRFKGLVRIASVLAIVLFVLLTNPMYWERIASIKHAGEDIEGMDTGAGRKELLLAQWSMFKLHPLGCGHRCTATLSPQYLEDRFLTGIGSNRERASHNTFMSLLVEQGIPGAALYLILVYWVAARVLTLRKAMHSVEGFLTVAYPAIAASLAAIFVGDLFVDYLKLEVRIWFLGFLLVLIKLVGLTIDNRESTQTSSVIRVAKPHRVSRHASGQREVDFRRGS